ncbi:catalase [Basidiobolus meristosporus CBS 931.73]|uniref:Catalase n=1 Tax=Basidiobolus meristosporus CBS 931.73 TaxID=1314790 RepID=A0A1Y1YU03_9FUNG|nr:catalase [Basidiobolus meristosporus CBS 931.73]|eukprot:ORY01523.1 catalase [Basidiobolus meristosporus CBS 931.73]
MTTSNGDPVNDNQTSMTAGRGGPMLIQDYHYIEKLAHFNRERIPERVVHAKGAGAHGYFEVTKDISHLTKAKFLSEVGKRTPVFTRFSTVGGESGSSDTARDPRGFAVKFYTEEGNWDMVGNNTPIFFIRDPIKFPDFIHTQKRNPKTHLKDPDAFWDFLSLTPESIHQTLILFSDRGTPKGFRHMNGYYGHTLKLVNEKGEYKYVKWHFKTDQGIQNFTEEEAVAMAGENPDYGTQDLFEAIDQGNHPSWTVYVQMMEPEQAATYRWDPFDITKVWPHGDFPLQEVGKMVLNKNPDNYFADTEQVAFSPSNMVPGIEASVDKMLQGRMFAYPDAHRYRVGPNFSQIPINQPRCPVFHGQRDGLMTVNGNFGGLPNYEPSSIHPGIPQQQQARGEHYHSAENMGNVSGTIGRHVMPAVDDDYVQAGMLYRVQPEDAKQRMISNIVGHLKHAKECIQQRQLKIFYKADAELGARIEEGLATRV